MKHESRKNGTVARADIYAKITARILASLEKGVRPWVQPWSTGYLEGRISRPLRHNGKPYSGINILLLWSETVLRGFRSPTWMTFRQAAELGAHVCKGETGSTVVYTNGVTRTETAGNGDEVERDIPFLTAYTVFNLEQINNLPDQYLLSLTESSKKDVNRIAATDAFFRGNRSRDPPRWHQCLLCSRSRYHPDAGDQSLSGRGILLRHPRTRTHSLGWS